MLPEKKTKDLVGKGNKLVAKLDLKVDLDKAGVKI